MIFKEGDLFEQTFTVSTEIYSDFIRLSNDKNPLHTDRGYAQEKGFEDVVMHGNILNAFISYFIGECLPIKDVLIHSQEIQFKNPVYKGTILQFSAEIAGIYESVNVVEFRYNFKNEALKVVAKGKVQIGLLK